MLVTLIKKKLTKETYNMYKNLVSDSVNLINTINATEIAEPRRRFLEIMRLIEEMFVDKKLETIPESEKLDIAQCEIDTADMPPLEDEKEAAKRQQKRLYFTDKLDLRGNKTIALAYLSIYYIW